MNERLLYSAFFLGVAVLLVPDIPAQVSYSTPGNLYEQNFDSLAQTGTANTWTNNTTIAGWYSTRTTYRAGFGFDTDGALYSFGSTGDFASDRALGTLPTNATGDIIFGVQLVNNTGRMLTSFILDWTGEQWRNGGGGFQTLVAQYSFDATSLTTGTWTFMIQFVSPKTGGMFPTDLDGNHPDNSDPLGTAVSSISWLNGTSLWIRWFDNNDSGADHGLAADDIIFSAAPEPSIRTATLNGSNFSVSINSYIGHSYQLRKSAILDPNSFTNVGSPQQGNVGAVRTFTDPNAVQAMAFYRIAVDP
ncbi:MAG TPA: hypothetical protein VJ719_10850 [Chthoniobacterales bacterium]|nr:hypothetical protein [Chthoniobacterales bacterium]